MYQQPNHALQANIGANQAGTVHPLIAALMQHLGNMNGTPQTAPAGTPIGNGATFTAPTMGGIAANPGHMNGTPMMGGQLPGVTMGAVSNQFAQTAQNAMNNGTASQQAAGLAGKLGGVSGMPMGAYGSFYGPMANQAGASQTLANNAAGMGGGMRMQGGG